MVSDLEKAKIMFKLARKGKWGGSYDRLEHFRRFNIKEVIKELRKKKWLIIYNKPKFTGISLNAKYKKEIIEFIEKEMPYIKGMIK